MTAVVMAFDAGLMISALSIGLMHEGVEQSESPQEMGIAFFAGALVFMLGDWLIDRCGGRLRDCHGLDCPLKKGRRTDTGTPSCF